MKKNKCSFVILNYQSCDLVISRIKSFQELSAGSGVSLVIVNNGDEQTSKLLAFCEKVDNVYYIETKNNLGYAAGNNIGIKKSYSLGADYVFVSNPDVTFCFQTVVAKMSDFKIGANVAVLSFEIDGVSQYLHSNNLFNLLFPYIRRFKDKSCVVQNGQKLSRFHGCFFGITRAYLEKVNCIFFDESTFLYFEEDIASSTISNEQFNIIFNDNFSVAHVGSVTVNATFPIKKYIFMYQSLSYLLKVNYFGDAFSSRFIAKPLAFISILSRYLTDRFRGN